MVQSVSPVGWSVCMDGELQWGQDVSEGGWVSGESDGGMMFCI